MDKQSHYERIAADFVVALISNGKIKNGIDSVKTFEKIKSSLIPTPAKQAQTAQKQPANRTGKPTTAKTTTTRTKKAPTKT